MRQAFGYSIDRAAIVKKLFGPLGVTEPANSLNPYVIAPYSDQNAWANYKLDLPKVNSLMTGDGWKKNSSGIWAKGGKTASFTIVTTAGNKRRELTEQIIQPMLKTAGFDMAIKNTSSDNLFGKQLPSGNYQLTLYAQALTSLTPGLCSVLCTKNIPGPSNNNSGNNWSFGERARGRPAAARRSTTDLNDAAAHVGGEAGRRHSRRQQRRAAARPAPRHPDLEQEGGRPDHRQPDRGHVLEHRSVGHHEVTFAQC